MVSRRAFGRALVGREVVLAYAAIVALYLARFVGVRPLQIPAYLLIVAYDVLEVALPFLTPYHQVGFPLFLYLLAIVGAGIARRLQSDGGDGPGLTAAVGGVCLVVGLLSLAFGATIGGPLIAPSDNPTPLAITGATGIVFLVGGWWLVSRPAGQWGVPG